MGRDLSHGGTPEGWVKLRDEQQGWEDSPALFGLVGYWPDGFPDYGFRPFEERLNLLESLRREVAETGSYGPEYFQAGHEDRE